MNEQFGAAIRAQSDAPAIRHGGTVAQSARTFHDAGYSQRVGVLQVQPAGESAGAGPDAAVSMGQWQAGPHKRDLREVGQIGSTPHFVEAEWREHPSCNEFGERHAAGLGNEPGEDDVSNIGVAEALTRYGIRWCRPAEGIERRWLCPVTGNRLFQRAGRGDVYKRQAFT